MSKILDTTTDNITYMTQEKTQTIETEETL